MEDISSIFLRGNGSALLRASEQVRDIRKEYVTSADSRLLVITLGLHSTVITSCLGYYKWERSLVAGHMSVRALSLSLSLALHLITQRYFTEDVSPPHQNSLSPTSQLHSPSKVGQPS